MFGIDRHALQVTWTVFLFVLALGLVYLVRDTLVVFALSLFFAYLLSPLVDFLESRFSARLSRPMVLAVVYVAVLGVVISALIPLGARIGEEAAALAGRLPDAIDQQDPLSRLPLPGWLEVIRPRLAEVVHSRVEELGRDVLPMLSRAGSRILSGIGNVLSLILIPILGFFFLKDGREIRNAIIQRAPPYRQVLVLDILTGLHLLLASYIRALVILGVATLISHSLFLTAMGVPYALLLGGMAAMLEVIPVLGPLTAGAVILLVAVLTGYLHVLWILVFLVVYRVFQDYVLNPYLMGAGVEIHPLLVLFGVLAGEQIAGIPGMFFSVPIIAALRVVVIRMRSTP